MPDGTEVHGPDIALTWTQTPDGLQCQVSLQVPKPWLDAWGARVRELIRKGIDATVLKAALRKES